MDKAWDLKNLAQRVKVRSLPAVEKAGLELVDEVLDWVQESIIKSESKLDDMALAFIPFARQGAGKLAEKLKGIKAEAPKAADEKPVKVEITKLPEA